MNYFRFISPSDPCEICSKKKKKKSSLASATRTFRLTCYAHTIERWSFLVYYTGVLEICGRRSTAVDGASYYWEHRLISTMTCCTPSHLDNIAQLVLNHPQSPRCSGAGNTLFDSANIYFALLNINNEENVEKDVTCVFGFVWLILVSRHVCVSLLTPPPFQLGIHEVRF